MPCRKSPFDACRTGAHRRQKQHMQRSRAGSEGGRCGLARVRAAAGRAAVPGFRPARDRRAGAGARGHGIGGPLPAGRRPRFRARHCGKRSGRAPLPERSPRAGRSAKRRRSFVRAPAAPARRGGCGRGGGTGGRSRHPPRQGRAARTQCEKGARAARMRRGAAAPAQPAPHRSRPRAGPRTAADGGPCPACHPGRRRAARRRRIPHPASRREPECMPGTLASPGPGGIRAQAAPRRRVTAGAGAGPVRAQMSGRRGWAGIGAGGRRRRRVHHCARTSRLRRASGQAAGAVQCAPMCPCTPRPSSTRAAPYPTRDGPGADAARPGLAHVPSSRGRHPLIGGLCAAVHGDRPAGVRCRLHPA